MLLLCAFVLPFATMDDAFIDSELSGWRGLPGLWSFKDGILTGDSGPEGMKSNTFLVSNREFADFELSFEVKLTGETANSGVQIRSAMLSADRLAVKGPQADMGAIYWGSLFGEHHAPGDKHIMMKQADWEKVGPTIKKDAFNSYSIRCVGQHVTIVVNGITTVDEEFPTLPARGLIAFQLHGGKAMKAAFKNIEFRELKKP